MQEEQQTHDEANEANHLEPREVKQPTIYEQQVEILKKHGCIIKEDDEAKCISKLSSIGYYRLSAYFLTFRQQDGTYLPGTSFDKVFQIYEFDRKLRNTLFGAIEVIEINLRSQLSYFHSIKYGSLGYLNTDNFNTKHQHDKFKANLDREISNHSKVAFVKHHIDNYGGKFPLWVAMEFFTFGMLSYFYKDLKTADKKEFARQMNVNYRKLEGWLRCCTDLRNNCAHYARLYNRIFTAAPARLDLNEQDSRKLWGLLLVVRDLYPSADKWNTEVITQIDALVDTYEKVIDLSHIAFPEDWKTKLSRDKGSLGG